VVGSQGHGLLYIPKAAMDMPWDIPAPRRFAEDTQQLSHSSPLLLETNETTIPVFHSKAIIEFQP